MAYVGYDAYNVPAAPYPVPPSQPEDNCIPPMPGPMPVPPGPVGTLPNSGYLVNYIGSKTRTAETWVDNRRRIIGVNVNKREVDNCFVYETPVPQADWEIHHNLGKYPSVTLVDKNNKQIMGDVLYLDTNTVVVKLSKAICGKAYLN